MEIVAFVIGVLIMLIGVMFSIALHEIGHLLPAKLFGVRVTQYMIGFGRTLFSKKVGETEYGIKAVPLGGYVAMIGMYPTNKTQEDSTGFFRNIADEARKAATAELQPGDETRTFIALPVWKRIIIMLGGPLMNLLIAAVITGILVTTTGVATPTTTLAAVYECTREVSAENTENPAESDSCNDQDPPSPATAAGLQPGDEITGFAGQTVDSWEELSELIGQRADEPTEIIYQRDGEQHTATITPELVDRPALDSFDRPQYDGDELITHAVGFIGVASAVENIPQPITAAPAVLGDQIAATGRVLVALPVKLWDTVVVLATNGQRDPTGPMSVVGVGRIAGETVAHEELTRQDQTTLLLSLMAGLNVALFVFNLIPLLPLDGGHVAGALWESLRRGWAKLRGKPDPGPFDIAKLLPMTWLVAGALLVMGVILIVADIFKPVELF